MRHIVSILSENETGALSRIVGLFSQRGYDIESLTAAPTENKNVSRITILTYVTAEQAEQISKQLHKLINVIKVSSIIDANEALEREVLFIKVHTPTKVMREEIKSLCDIFGASIEDVTTDQYILQYVGSSNEIDRFIKIIVETTDIIEIIRSGVCAINRGDISLSLKNNI